MYACKPMLSGSIWSPANQWHAHLSRSSQKRNSMKVPQVPAFAGVLVNFRLGVAPSDSYGTACDMATDRIRDEPARTTVPGIVATGSVLPKPKRSAQQIISLWILGIVILSSIGLATQGTSLLWGDESTYFHQARALREGRLVWFEYSQPILFPILLAPFSGSLAACRLVVAAMMSTAMVLLFTFVRRHSDSRLALFTWILLLTMPMHLWLGGAVYGEAVFLMLGLLYVNAVERSTKYPVWFALVGPGTALALATLARPPAIMFAAIPLTARCLEMGRDGIPVGSDNPIYDSWLAWARDGRIRIVVGHLLLATTTFAIWSYSQGNHFAAMLLSTKGSISHEQLFATRLKALPSELSRPVFFLAMISALSALLSWKWRTGHRVVLLLSLVGAFVFLVTAGLLNRYVFARHLYPAYPFICCLAASSICSIVDRIATVRRNSPDWRLGHAFLVFSLLALLAVHVADSAGNARQFLSKPRQGSIGWNRYYLATPGCISIQHLQLEGCHKSRLTAQDDTALPDREITLPWLTQPEGSRCQLSGTFSNALPIRSVYLSYLDDSGALFVDGRQIPSRASVLQSSWDPVTIPPGAHMLQLIIDNGESYGGIGQVLLCEEAGPAWM